MKALKTLTAIAAPIEGDNIDTDRLIPARLMRNPRDQNNDYSQFLFHDQRFNDDGSENSDFVLNQNIYRNTEIIVSGSNFGCGSSRESAVYALVDYGVRIVIAESFGDIFYANCVRNGVAPLRMTAADCTSLRNWLADAKDPSIEVDLRTLKVRAPNTELYWAVEIPEFQRNCLMQGLDEVELTLTRSDAISAFEERYLHSRPWLVTEAT